MAQPIKRGGIYWLRKKVPDDLRPLVNKTEEKFSLKTRDPAEARILFAKAVAEIEERWGNLRRGRVTLTTKQAWAVAGEIYRDFVKDHEDHPEKASLTLMLLAGNQINSGTASVSVGGTSPGRSLALYQKLIDRVANPPELKKYLDRRGWVLNEESMTLVLKAVREAMLQGRQQVFRYDQGDYSADPRANRFPSVELPTGSSPAPDQLTLSTAIAAWVKEKTRKDGDWVDSSAESNELWARRFQELVGERPLQDYRKADARKFKEAIMSLPPNFLQKENFKKLDFLEAVERAKTANVDKMSDRNVNKILGFVRAFWNWAEAQYDDVPSNPFNKMNLRLTTKARDERDSFTPDQLQKIFSAPLYTGCKSAKSYLTPGSHVPSDESIYWVPLIGLFTGARSGEIIQLLCDDVKFAAGIRYFDIRDDGERKKTDLKQGLKTDSSVRVIPVHQLLEKLGFAAFVERQRKKGQRLFPDFSKGVDGYYSTAYSTRFKRFLEKIDVKTDKTSFHSFRHTFEDGCRNSRIPLEFINAFQGHSDGGMADRYGTGMVRVRLLKEEMDKLKYEDLDLSRLIAARNDLIVN